MNIFKNDKYRGIFIWLLFLWLISASIGLKYFSNIEFFTIKQLVFLAVFFIGHFGVLSLFFSLPIFIISKFLSKKYVLILGTIYSVILISMLYIDASVFTLYRYHLNKSVLGFFLADGLDAFNFSSWMIFTSALIILAISVIIITLGYLAVYKFNSKLKKLPIFITIFFIGFFGVFKIWYAYEDANYNKDIIKFHINFPLDKVITAKTLLDKLNIVDHQQIIERKRIKKLESIINAAKLEKSNFNYPLSTMLCSEPIQKPNILFILIDALRQEMLDDKYLPSVTKFSHKPGVWKAQHHTATGNSTHFGIFQLFYGMPAKQYWNMSYNTSPVFFQILKKFNYDINILSSASLETPYFPMNVFSNIYNLRINTPGDNSNQRDVRITQDWLDFTSKYKKNKKPFFGFLFYDSVHSYMVPPDFPKIQPYAKELNYLQLNNKVDNTSRLNRYKTSVQYTDSLIKKVLDDLKQKDLLRNTIVVFTSDHGESFNDNNKNHWGHGGAFSKSQTVVPFFIYLPNSKGGSLGEFTSHNDVMPSLLKKVFKCQNPVSDYSLGSDMFNYNSGEYKMAIGSNTPSFLFITKDAHLIMRSRDDIEILGNDLSKLSKEKEDKIFKHAEELSKKIDRFIKK